jgi:hypothetical protein
MAIVVGLDVHRAQITYDALDTASGEVTTGRIAPSDRATLRRFLDRWAGEEVAAAVEAMTGWRFVVEEFLVAYVGFAATGASIAGLGACFLSAGVAIGCVETAEHAAVAALAAEDIRGSAFGLLAGVQSLGNLVASGVAGVLRTLVSPAAGLLFAAALMGVSLAGLLWGRSRRSRSLRKRPRTWRRLWLGQRGSPSGDDEPMATCASPAHDVPDAAVGALVGAFVGDALGMPYEGQSGDAVPDRVEMREGRAPAGKLHRRHPDDVALAESLLRCGTVDGDHLAATLSRTLRAGPGLRLGHPDGHGAVRSGGGHPGCGSALPHSPAKRQRSPRRARRSELVPRERPTRLAGDDRFHRKMA